ncbi:MAG: hypothetical protein RSA86_01475 [Christensenellaceae bacterium]
MQIYYDFHIHSALSPCGEDDMTPNNIVNMAKIKGLDAIAVCDHNSTKNVQAIGKVAADAGLTLLPAAEVTTAEEVHILVVFENILQAVAFGDAAYDVLPNIKNNTEFFGNQFIMNEKDEVIGQLDKLLISALPYDIDKCCDMAKEYGGYVIPAHVNKDANSIFANLGFFPPQLKFKTIETVKGLSVEGDISGFEVIHSSDAHNLWQIAEKENFIDVQENNVSQLIKKLCL